MFHSLKAKLLYITKRKIPDIEQAVEFLTTRVAKINVDDWKKLRRYTSYLNQMVKYVRIIGDLNLTYLLTWVDDSHVVHPNMLRQTGGLMSMGYGMLHCRSSKKNISAKV